VIALPEHNPQAVGAPERTEITVLQLFKRRKRYNYVFIFTYGRSGSTLLMGLLNSLPHYCIRGENNNLLYRLYWSSEALNSALASPSAKNAAKPTNPWFGLDSTNPARFNERLIEAFVDDAGARTRPYDCWFQGDPFLPERSPRFRRLYRFRAPLVSGCKIIFNHRN
jgi:hypothetical protein